MRPYNLIFKRSRFLNIVYFTLKHSTPLNIVGFLGVSIFLFRIILNNTFASSLTFAK